VTDWLKRVPSRILANLATTTALGATLIVGCSDEGNPVAPGPVAPTSVTLTGGFIGTSSSGQFNVTILSANLAGALGSRSLTEPITAFGTAIPSSGDTIDLTGTYNRDTHVVLLSGSGYSFNGSTVTGGASHVIKGGWSGPPGTGFFGCSDGAGDNAYLSICTDFENGSGASVGGAKLLLFQSQITGIAVTAYSPDPFTVTGTSVPKQLPDGTFTKVEDFEFSGSLPGGGPFTGMNIVATGFLDTRTNAAQGSWTIFNGADRITGGSWSDLPCQ
jgi:hypothetical protein